MVIPRRVSGMITQVVFDNESKVFDNESKVFDNESEVGKRLVSGLQP